MDKGKICLKLSGTMAIIMGIICVFLGFFIMSCGMTLKGTETAQQLKTLKLISAGGLYILANGAYYTVSGFIGFMNAAEAEAATKCLKLAIGLAVFAVINIIALVILAFSWNRFMLGVVVIPAAISILYIAGSIMNYKAEKNTKASDVNYKG